MVGGVVDCNVERWDFTEDVVRESGWEKKMLLKR